MKYYEIAVTFFEAIPWKEIFVLLLADLGCDSFAEEESEDILFAYISEDNYIEENIKALFVQYESKTVF